MRVNQIRGLLCGLLVLCSANIGYNQVGLSLKLGDLDNRAARFWEDGQTDTTSFSTLNTTDLTIDDNGELYLEINPGARLVATVRLIFSGGSLSAVEWKDGDESEHSSFTQLNTDLYLMELDGTFHLYGQEVSLNPSATDLTNIYIPELWTTNYDGSFSGNVFPGDYRFALGDAQNGKGTCEILFDLNDSGGWVSGGQWQAAHGYGAQSPSWKSLATSWYSISTGVLTLNGQTTRIDLNVDNEDLFLSGYFGSAIDAKDSVKLFPGNIELQIGTGDGHAATFQAMFDPDSGDISPVVYWYDSDSSQSDTNNALPPTYFVHQNDTISIQGDTAWLDLTASDNKITVPGFTHVGPGYEAEVLLPGDYQVLVTGTDTRICLEMVAGAGLRRDAQYAEMGSGMSEGLNTRFYERSPDSLRLGGMELSVDISALTRGKITLASLKSGQDEFTFGNSYTRNFLPAAYRTVHYTVFMDDPAYAEYFTVSNREGGIAGPVQFTDLATSSTPDVPDGPYPISNVYARRGGITFHDEPPVTETVYSAQYALLRRKPDGAFYTLPGSTLFFQYTAEYKGVTDVDADPEEDLTFAIYDWHRTNVASSLSLNREYGDNRYSLALGTLGLTTGDHYLLEVTNEKNETFYLRFKYGQ